ncbi:hypothetical protein JOL62DRAFT_608902 [Phyllosticta paracitricarpa]|uniref:Rhodopsin domain-containing protein n=2 Tax=Phyllosticta TaxID=121621 RepID=A0ABR1MLT2_9PEZI
MRQLHHGSILPYRGIVETFWHGGVHHQKNPLKRSEPASENKSCVSELAHSSQTDLSSPLIPFAGPGGARSLLFELALSSRDGQGRYGGAAARGWMPFKGRGPARCDLVNSRIFPLPGFRTGAYILGFITVGWVIAINCVSIFQCTPIKVAWDTSIGAFCINLRASLIGNAIPNVQSDVAILAMPVGQVFKLQVTMAQKFSLCIMFLLGSL